MTVDEISFTALEAIHLVTFSSALGRFLDDNHLKCDSAFISKLYGAYDAATEADHAAYQRLLHSGDRAPWRGWRPDAQALLQFVDRSPGLGGRMREVAELCLRHGLSIDACAKQMGLKRESVRTHLRRLRYWARKRGALSDLQPLEWPQFPAGCERGKTPLPVVRE